MRSNLKTILKTRITARLKSVTAKLKVLVADGEATQILLECGCSPNWLADIGYIGQEKLERDRKGISKHDAVYLISPNLRSVQQVCREMRARRYAAAHIVVTAGITEEMFSELRTIQDSIKMLEEFHINFYPAESQIFHLNMPNAIQMLHNPNTDLRDDCISIIASKLLSVFSTLDDFPDIRYYDPKRKRNTLSAKIAERLHENLLELSLHNEKFPTPSSYPGPTTLIIVDRSIDFLAPLMHSLSFQAVVHDFYEVEDRYGLEEKHVVCDIDDEHYAVLDESNEIFVNLRHKFFNDASKSIDSFRHVHAREVEEAKKPLSAANGGVDKLMGMMANVQLMNKRAEQLLALAEISTTMTKTIVQANLRAIVELEQDLAMGETAEGLDVKDAYEELMERLSDSNKHILPRDKLRLLLIYLLTLGGLSKEQRDRLLTLAGYSGKDDLALTGLRFLGANISDTLKDLRCPASPFAHQRRKPAISIATTAPNPRDPRKTIVTGTRVVLPTNLGGGGGAQPSSSMPPPPSRSVSLNPAAASNPPTLRPPIPPQSQLVLASTTAAAAAAAGGPHTPHTRKPEHRLTRFVPALYHLVTDLVYARPIVASWFPSLNHPDKQLVDYSLVLQRRDAVLARSVARRGPAGRRSWRRRRRRGDPFGGFDYGDEADDGFDDDDYDDEEYSGDDGDVPYYNDGADVSMMTLRAAEAAARSRSSSPAGGGGGITASSGVSTAVRFSRTGGIGQVKILDGFHSTWGRKRPVKGGRGGIEDEELRENGPRVVVFVVGGLSYPEVRAAYEATKNLRREVFFGSTHMLTPRSFVDALFDVGRAYDEADAAPIIDDSPDAPILDPARTASPRAGRKGKSSSKRRNGRPEDGRNGEAKPSGGGIGGRVWWS